MPDAVRFAVPFLELLSRILPFMKDEEPFLHRNGGTHEYNSLYQTSILP